MYTQSWILKYNLHSKFEFYGKAAYKMFCKFSYLQLTEIGVYCEGYTCVFCRIQKMASLLSVMNNFSRYLVSKSSFLIMIYVYNTWKWWVRVYMYLHVFDLHENFKISCFIIIIITLLEQMHAQKFH